MKANLSIIAVAVQVPLFWRKKSTAWFCQLKARFALAGFTMNTTRFNHAFLGLDEKAIVCFQRIRELQETERGIHKAPTKLNHLVKIIYLVIARNKQLLWGWAVTKSTTSGYSFCDCKDSRNAHRPSWHV